MTMMIILATRQTDDSSSVIQIPTTTPIIPNRREIRGWVIVGKQIVSFYEVRVNSRKEKLTWNSFTCVSQHKCIEIYLFSHKLIYLSSAKKCLFNFLVCLIVFIQFDKLSYNGLRNSTYIYYIRAVGKTTPSIVFIVIYNKIYKKVNDDRKLNKLLDS